MVKKLKFAKGVKTWFLSKIENFEIIIIFFNKLDVEKLFVA